MEYLIGAGAFLEAGEQSSITPATVHARIDPGAGQVLAAAIDFEATSAGRMRRLLVLTSGSDGAGFDGSVLAPIKARRDCTLADVLQALAVGAGTQTVHVFAHWEPAPETAAQLEAAGITLVALPLEAIQSAALVCGQRRRRWEATSAA